MESEPRLTPSSETLLPSSASPNDLIWSSYINDLFYSNLLWAEWISFSASVSLIGILVIFCSNLVPEAIQRVFKYGKAADLHVTSDGIKKLHKIELPKRWFFHFYLFGSIFYLTLFYGVIQVYVYKQNVPKLVQLILDSFVGKDRQASVAPESVMICMFLILAQVGRRLSECTFLSVYSNAKMNIVHYIFGLSFYFGVGLSVIAEAPGFTGKGLSDVHITGHFISVNHVVGIITFILASIMQFNSHRILANLRKDKKGNVVTLEHSIPRGSFFDYISSPHYFAEILIYLSLNLIFSGRSMTWWMVCCFVVINQVVVGLFNHHWYLQTFKDYPKSRKAVIPFFL